MDILKAIDKIYPEITEIRRHIHMYPELGEEERETSAFICRKLDEYGISYQSGVAGYGVVGQVGKGSRAVGIRADIDALPIHEATGLPYASKVPGVMHACGHDMHTAILIGTGKILKELEEKIDEVDGAVKLFFQPSEESIGGAERMIAEGHLKNPEVESMIAIHVDPNYPAGTIVLKYGPMNAETQGFRLTVRGKSCHGAHPDLGIDTIVLTAEIIMGIQTISSRFNDPDTPVVVTVGSIHGGDAGNVIPGEVTMKGTMRTLSHEMMEKNKKQLHRIATGIAEAYGGSAILEFESGGYPALINDDDVIGVVENNARRFLGEDKVAIMKTTSLGGDDFAFFTKATKGAYFNLGTAVEGQPFYALHNEHYAPAEEAMKNGMAIEVLSALDLLGVKL
jgi:amidohydrolase